MIKMLSGILFCICVSLNSLSYAAETDIPLPNDAVKTMEKSANIGPSPTTIQTYETALSPEKLSAFYKKAMGSAGWREQRQGFFLKENYLAIIVVIPRAEKAAKTQFTLTTSRVPTKEEMLASRKETPDKLNFMPVYPGSAQIFLWDTPTGISASYETKDSIKDVDFFYKSGMLNYGWSLESETPITTQQIKCPECEKAMVKIPQEAIKPAIQGTASKANLLFRRGSGEGCNIRLYENNATLQNAAEISAASGKEAEPLPSNKTTILVTYNATKKINP